MSLVDYSQTADDHQSLLILIRHTGSNLTTQAFNSAWDRIRHVDCIHIQGQKRNIWVRYKRGYPKENNEWGDFQAHRKVLGLISVGKCSSHEEFESLFEAYKSVKDEYSSTIYNSRLIVFGMNKDGSPFTDSELPPEVTVENGQVKDGQHKSSLIEANVKDKRTDRHVRQTDGPLKHSKEETSHLGSHSLTVADSSETVTSEISSQRSHSGSLTKESTGAEVVFYPSLEKSDDLEERLREFITSLFFVLEGKRLDRSFERTERLQLLCAPFEKKDYVGIDPESKSVKKKCMGRLRKHLADLCLQAGMPGEAILHYQTALDVLRAVNDFLWMGGCYEGLSTASVILKYPKTPTLKRNLSLSVTKGTSMDAAARSIPYANGLDMIDRTAAGVLHPDDIIEKYEEAIKHYSKYKSAAMIEMEASFKACRVLVLQKVPASLITTNWNGSFLPASDSPHQIINHHIQLQDSFLRFHANPACRAASLRLENFYCAEVGRIEMGRYQALSFNRGRQSVNLFYDGERVKLACKVRTEMDKIRLASSLRPAGSGRDPLSPVATTPTTRTSSSSSAAFHRGLPTQATSLPSASATFLGAPPFLQWASPVMSKATCTSSGAAASVHKIASSMLSSLSSSSGFEIPTSASAEQILATSSPSSSSSFSSASRTAANYIKQTPLTRQKIVEQAENVSATVDDSKNTPASTSTTAAADVVHSDSDVSSPVITSTSSPVCQSRQKISTFPSRIISDDTTSTSTSTSPTETSSDKAETKSSSPNSSTSDFLSPGDDNRGSMMSSMMMLTPQEQTRQQRHHVTQVLTEWYESHVQYPYPSDDDVATLSDLTETKPSQVRKWLANKRVRSFNTLSITGNDHPIKYKYQQKSGSATTTVRRPQYKVLNGAAKKVLSDWFEARVDNPYPTDEEKEELALSAGISTSQVKSWFANKRSRTNNTRRQVPNYFIKKYPSYTPIVEMVVHQREQRRQASHCDRLRMSLFQ